MDLQPFRPLIVFLALVGCASREPLPLPPPPAAEPNPAAEPVARPLPLAAGIARLKERAGAERSAALLLWVDGEWVIDEMFGNNPRKPLFAMSVSKSVTALRIGQLVDEGALTLDEPLSTTVMPEWHGTDKAPITLRHILTHTSGLATERYATDAEGFRNGTIEDHAATLELVGEPGHGFVYNNAATDLLAVIVRRARNLPLDDQLQDSLFGPLDIAGAFWAKDGRGDPRSAGGLAIRPHDLMKIGRLVLDRGVYDGRRLVSESWIDLMVQPSSEPWYGLLWWLDRRKGDDAVASYVADGYLGQYIVVVPEARAVAVRMRDPNTTSWNPDEYTYAEFRHDVLAACDATPRVGVWSCTTGCEGLFVAHTAATSAPDMFSAR